MKWARALRFIALGLALAYAFPVACGGGGVVGGKCRKGFGTCDGTAAGGDGPGTNSKGGASSTGGSIPTEAGNGAAASPQGGDGQLPDGGFFDSPVDGQSDAEAPLECLPPHDSPSHCGDCDTQCQDPAPFCKPVGDGTFECVPMCDLPLVECQGQCMDPAAFNTDPENCGKCGEACPSDICQDGTCRGARFGNVALLCSDFNSATSDSAPTVLLGNALFLPVNNPVQVLAYTRGAAPAAVNRVNTVIEWAGFARKRVAQITDVNTVDAVTNSLNIDNFQVLLIHDLDLAKAGDPAAAATIWESANVLTSFTKAGGVVVVLDGGDGTGEMNQLINAGRLLDPSAQTSISDQTQLPAGAQVWNNAPFDVLGLNVLSPFLGTSHTCTFDTDTQESDEVLFVLSDDQKRGAGAPMAIHRVIAP